MLKRCWSVGLASVLAVAAISWSVDAQQASVGTGYGASGVPHELITHFLPSEGHATALTIVDPVTKRIAVYHIARDTGEIQLKSLRNITGDLGLDYWNSGSPLPQEIIEGLKRGK